MRAFEIRLGRLGKCVGDLMIESNSAVKQGPATQSDIQHEHVTDRREYLLEYTLSIPHCPDVGLGSRTLDATRHCRARPCGPKPRNGEQGETFAAQDGQIVSKNGVSCIHVSLRDTRVVHAAKHWGMSMFRRQGPAARPSTICAEKNRRRAVCHVPREWRCGNAKCSGPGRSAPLRLQR